MSDEELAEEIGQPAEPEDPARCPDCGYLRTAPGHRITCGSAA